MSTSSSIYPQVPEPRSCVVNEQDIESAFIEKLKELKYTHRPDIRDRATQQYFATFPVSQFSLLMTAQQRLGKTLWAIADPLRGAMNADAHFRGVPKVIPCSVSHGALCISATTEESSAVTHDREPRFLTSPF
jgi:hypothetical protein